MSGGWERSYRESSHLDIDHRKEREQRSSRFERGRGERGTRYRSRESFEGDVTRRDRLERNDTDFDRTERHDACRERRGRNERRSGERRSRDVHYSDAEREGPRRDEPRGRRMSPRGSPRDAPYSRTDGGDEHGRDRRERRRRDDFEYEDREDAYGGRSGEARFRDNSRRWTEETDMRDMRDEYRRRGHSDRQRSPSPFWGRSPSPPRSLGYRLEVGASRKRKQERREERKERKAKRARGVYEENNSGLGSAGVNGSNSNSKLRSADGGEGPNTAEEAVKVSSVSEVPVTGTSKETEKGRPAEFEVPTTRVPNPNKDVEDDDEDEEEGVLGPSLPAAISVPGRGVDYGKALLPGEASAMAAFIQDGKRIPRRGEIGLSSNQISKFEDQGYVMSGSRNRRMEAVRIRKENQVYTAEELAALSQFSHEEKLAREKRILNEFRAYVASKLGDDAVPAPEEGPKNEGPDSTAK